MENKNNILIEEQELLDKKLAIAIQKGNFNSSQNLIENGAKINSPIVTNSLKLKQELSMNQLESISELEDIIILVQNSIGKTTGDDNNKELLENVKYRNRE